MPRCPECGHYFRQERETVLVPPVDSSYVDNALNIAEYFFGERTWEFYKLPYYKFRDCMCQWYEGIEPRPPAEDKLATKRWTSKRASYFEFTEARIAYAINFCAREGSAYRLLKERLQEKVDEGGYDENDEFEPFSVEHEFHRLQDELQEQGIVKTDRDDMFVGFKKGQSAVSRLLILRVEGAEKYVPISDCHVSDYFPELREAETENKAAIDD